MVEELSEAEKKAERGRLQTMALAGLEHKDFFQIIADFISSIFEMIFGKGPDDGEEPDAPPQTYEQRVQAATDFVNSAALPAWQQYMAENKGVRVVHHSPLHERAKVTSGKGHRNTGIAGASHDHQGIDMDVTQGETAAIHPSAPGIVVFSGVLNGYGNTVVIGHADGTKTLYAHMTDANKPKMGKEVIESDVIGQMGNTTNGKNKIKVHLHYEQWDTSKTRRVPIIDGKEMHKEDFLNGTDREMAGNDRPALAPVSPAAKLPAAAAAVAPVVRKPVTLANAPAAPVSPAKPAHPFATLTPPIGNFQPQEALNHLSGALSHGIQVAKVFVGAHLPNFKA